MMEVSFRVEPERLAAALADFLTRRGKAGGARVEVAVRE
jgi:hypothetical protein